MEFVKKEGFSDNAIAEYLAEEPKGKRRYILAEMAAEGHEVVTKYLGFDFKSEPSMEELRAIATSIFNSKYRNTVAEFTSGNPFYSNSRKQAIDEILSKFWILNIEDGSFACAMELLQKEREGLLPHTLVARGIHSVHVKGKNGAKEIRKTIPNVGKVNIKRCPFCGRIDLYFSPKDLYEDDKLHWFSIKCTCGTQMSSLYYETVYCSDYADIVRCVIDRWNYRGAEE